MLTMLSPRALRPPSANTRAWTTRTTVMTSRPAAGPTSTAANTPPRRCPLIPAITGKLTICAANTKAAARAASGTWRSVRTSRVRRTATPKPPTATAPNPAEVVTLMTPSGMCTVDSSCEPFARRLPGGAIPTQPGEGEVAGIDDEPGGLGDASQCSGEVLGIDLRGGTTPLTHQVLVRGLIGDVVHRRSVAEVGVGEHPGSLQGIEGAIDRRLGGAPLEVVGDGSCGEVIAVRAGDHPAHRNPRRGGTQSRATQCCDEVVCRDVHDARLRRVPPEVAEQVAHY